MKTHTVQDEEPATLSEVFDELLVSMHESLKWARGERESRTFTRSTDDAFYVKPESAPSDSVEAETGVDGKLATCEVAPFTEN